MMDQLPSRHAAGAFRWRNPAVSHISLFAHAKQLEGFVCRAGYIFSSRRANSFSAVIDILAWHEIARV